MPLSAYWNNFTKILTTGLHFLNLFLVICFSGASVAEFDDAFVEVSGEMQDLSENNQEVNETLFKTSAGRFSRIGSKKSLEGELHEFSGCSEENIKATDDNDDTHSVPKLNWIAYLHIPATEYGTSHETSCSIIERIKKAMLFGASAIVIFSVHKKIFKKLDLPQIFTHPVVLVSDSQANKIKQEYKRGRKLYIKIADKNPTCKKYVQMFSTVTLWSTCFRPSEGSGVICPPSPVKDNNISNSLGNIWSWTSCMAFTLCACFLIKIKFRQWQEAHWMQHVEKTLQKLAKEALSKMKTRTLKSSGSEKPTKGQSDICAVCLDEFFSGQVVRVLHCRHEFHIACVDPWLLIKRTCPLCKHDIIGDKTLACLTD